jgi:hemerythrin HHE cation binding domain-containing protein
MGFVRGGAIVWFAPVQTCTGASMAVRLDDRGEISMADNKSRGRSTDRKRLNMGEAYEVAYAKSERASPARKALLAKGEAARGARSAKKAGSASTKSSRTTDGAAKRGTTAKRATTAKRGTTAQRGSTTTHSSAAKRSGVAKRGAGASTRSAGPSSKRATSASAKKGSPRKTSAQNGGAAQSGSASPAMKRSSAAPRRAPAQASTRPTPTPPKEEKTAENTAPKTMKEADAVDLLTDDHLQVGALFKQYEKLARRAAPADQRRTLAQTICDMLKTHTAIEEEIFYPAARKAGIDADMLDEADVEHASAKDLIAQIESGNPDGDHYDAKVKVLGEYITHHVVEEHTEMFTKCRRSGMDLVGLRAELEERKMSLQPSADENAGAAGSDSGKSPGLLSKLSDTLFAKA